MPFYMNRLIPIVLFLSLLLATISGCRERYDSKLQTPDIDEAGMDHGYNLTSLGCLVYRPWNIKSEDNSDSISLNNLVFELQKNGDLYYWFKADYLKSPNDTITLADGNKSYGHTIWKSDYLLEQKWLKNIYKKGHWVANFKDSSIQISFGDNQFSLQPIKGKYTSLGSSEMTIKQDKVKGEMRKTYLSFEHY
jgi:hypothetical protein